MANGSRFLLHNRTLVKSVDAARMTAAAVLTYPEVDYAGDLVEPSGGEWPEVVPVNLEHLHEIGTGTVQLREFPNVLKGKPAVLPVGTTQFNPNSKLSSQVFRLVADDKMTGVSLEFTPISGQYKSFAHPSPLEPNRDAAHFLRWRGQGWAHTMQPVNPNARTVEKAMTDLITPLVQAGRVGSEEMHPVLKKSLSQYLQPRAATVRSGWGKKAMGDDQTPLTTEDTMAVADMPADDGLKPTPKALMAVVQGLKDLCDQAEGLLEAGEDKEGIARIKQTLEAIKAEADTLLADGQSIFPDAGLDAPTADDEDAVEGEEIPDVEVGEPLPETDDGAYMGKSFRKGFPVRFKLSDSRPVKKAQPTAEQSAEVARLKTRLANLQRTLGRR